MSTQTPETFETFVTEDAQAQAYAMPEFENFENLPDAPEPEVVEQPKKPKKKNKWFCRLLAFLCAVAPIVIYFLLPIKHLFRDENNAYVFEGMKFFDHMFGLIKDNFGTNKDFFGFLPMHLDPNSTMDMAITTIMYLIPIALVVCAIFGLVALCSKKAAPYCLRFITGTNFVMAMLYATAMVLIAAWYDPSHNSEVTVRWLDGIDYTILGIAGVSFLIYLIASFVKAGKWAFLDLIIFLLTATSVCAVAYGLVSNPDLTRDFLTGKNDIYATITFILIGADIFFLICALIGISAKKLHGIDVVRAIFMTLVGGFLVVLCLLKAPEFNDLMIPSIIAAASAFVMLIIEAITIGVRNSKKKKAAKAAKAAAMEEVAEAPEFEAVEETVAQPFETEAVAEVEETAVEAVAEVAPEEEAVPFDPFLETLSKEERKQFGELTINIQKIEGMPRFEAGGDNKVFFRKIFVNLGSIRGLVPDGLMEKIYQFTIRL